MVKGGGEEDFGVVALDTILERELGVRVVVGSVLLSDGVVCLLDLRLKMLREGMVEVFVDGDGVAHSEEAESSIKGILILVVRPEITETKETFGILLFVVLLNRNVKRFNNKRLLLAGRI